MYKIVIAGASSLLSRELKDVFTESPLAASTFALLDEEEEAHGQLEQVGDEVTFIQAISSNAFDHADFTFFCGSENLTLRYWQQALRAGSTVLDLSGALDRETGVLIRAPWLGTEAAAVDLFTPAIVPAHPAVIALALMLERLQQAAPVRLAAATVLLPSSEFGRAAMDELHQQTVNLLNFQGLPRGVYDAQAAFNLLSGMGEEAQVSLARVEDRIRRHYEALSGGRGPALAVQVIHAPVFHGHTFSLAVELERPVETVVLEEALSGEHIELILEDTDSPSNLAVTGQNEVLVRLRPEPLGRNTGQATRLWLWAAADNLRLNAQNAVQCALDLRRLRPQGTVQ
ncbi:MAG: Asd/ArgC dimerization domain-containing protein [Terracidiphilus sp.]